VSDPQGAVIVGVKITAVQIGASAKFEAVSDSDGIYTIPFLPPAAYRLRPTRFSNLRQDSVRQVDFSVINSFRITESVRMTYRCEFFTGTNRAIFNAPDLVPTSSTFGKVTSQANTPGESSWLCG